MIICLHGLKGSGKDTVAAYLIERHGFKRFAYADDIYRQVAEAFNVLEEDLRSREWKITARPELALRNCSDMAFVRRITAAEMPHADYNISPFCEEAQTCPRNSTFIVQRWGTEYRRADHGENYWSNIEIEKIKKLPPGSRVVISDLRENHEIELLEWFTRTYGPMKCGVLEIRAPGTVNTGHLSDNNLDRQYIDKTVFNTPGDFAGLYNQVEDFLQRGMKWKPLNP